MFIIPLHFVSLKPSIKLDYQFFFSMEKTRELEKRDAMRNSEKEKRLFRKKMRERELEDEGGEISERREKWR